MRFAYCTGMRRCDCSTKTMSAMMMRPTARTMKKVFGPFAVQIEPIARGKLAAIEVKISNDIPLPMPFSVMSSAIHMIRPVPAVMVITMSRIEYQLSLTMEYN